MWIFIFEDDYLAGMALGIFCHDIHRAVGRSVITDIKSEIRIGLRQEALDLLGDKYVAINIAIPISLCFMNLLPVCAPELSAPEPGCEQDEECEDLETPHQHHADQGPFHSDREDCV